ncbi:phosphoribulokinase/uridine kinase [Lucifera butyrica]|uniref:Phosphoribulokinase/uridine kinase n=1 Tax=Lucifera butyrica TaxID=1351585 RepID=A0A498RB49_9FIRM|nr:nucleoside kinase [Lucifera butyrica]VBB08704.1 phosphoribulokinase/uridine kinase [Lucifera butyrica]
MQKMITVHFANGMEQQYAAGTTLLEISRHMAGAFSSPIVVALVNNEYKDLQVDIQDDCNVDFLDLNTDPGMKVYQRSLCFVMITAVCELFPSGEVTVEHSLDKGLYCELYLGRKVTAEDVRHIEQRVKEIVAEKRPLVRKVLPIQEAIELFEATGRERKVKLLRRLNRDKVSIYYCGDVCDYFYGNMVPHAGYLPIFELSYYPPGFILRFPTKENVHSLPPFKDQPKLAQIFSEAEQWGEILDCGYVGNLNEHIEKNNIKDLIRVAEALHEKKLAQIADFISEHRKTARLILVSGPSSSGKTTFAQRLRIQLRVNGMRPVPISLDDYFVNREYTPRDETGAFDFEAIEAIDLKLFNEHITRLLSGEPVELPSFNFATGQREYRGNVIQIDKEQPLIIEGIHGLNERLTQSVSRDYKVKIYVSALTQLSIDRHNRIPTTDARLIRRIVRDNQFRGYDALRTLFLWPSVRRGEEKNIFPFQEEADMMFNSALIYELAVLKKYAQPLLEKIGSDRPEYAEARRMLNFLEYFMCADDSEVPPNSILREFIGQSCFY